MARKKAITNETVFSDLDKKIFLAMSKDPVLFVQKAFGVQPTEQQAKLLRSVAQKDSKTTVASGHGTGKSASLSWLIHWFLIFFDDVKIPCTAPTASQLHDVLWSELQKWHQKYIIPHFKESLVITSDRMYVIGAEKTRYAVARTSAKDKPEALQGFHAKNLLVIVDEASGVDNKVFEVAEGTLSTKNARIVLVSNPTRNSGYFYDTHRNQKISKEWSKLEFSCLESDIATDKFCKDMEKKYGVDSNVYRVRVLGKFPELGDDCIISRKSIEDAIDRDVHFPSSEKIAGLDPARYGDDSTAIVIRQGGKIIHIDQWRGKGIDETIGKVVALHKEGMFDKIFVDSIGLGAGVVDMLPHKNVPCIGVNVSERTSDKEKYNKLRDELWFNAKEFFDDLGCSIDSKCDYLEDFINELSSITYKFLPNGKLKVEGKDEMKARGVSSPNLADAFNLTLYNYQTPTRAMLNYLYRHDNYEAKPSMLL